MAPRPNHRGRVTSKGQKQDQPVPAVGRRPSSPAFLFVLGVIWILCGVIALVGLSASWKLVPAIVFIGIGALFLRGAATTIVRRNQ